MVALYKIIVSYPEVVSVALPRLADKLSDPDQGMRDTLTVVDRLTVS